MKPIMLEVNSHEKISVIKDFPNKINDWCKFTSQEYNIPKDKMCFLAVQVFSKYFTSRWIQMCINEEYKNKAQSERSKNKPLTKEKKEKRIKKALQRCSSDLKMDFGELLEDIKSMSEREGEQNK
jgi:dephospho-CoA kinase